MTGICMVTLLDKLGKQHELTLIRSKYQELGIQNLDYAFYFKGTGSTERNKKNSCRIEALDTHTEIIAFFNSIWTNQNNDINSQTLIVHEGKVNELKTMIPAEWHDLLYAVIGLKIYCERLVAGHILPEITRMRDNLITYEESDALSGFKALSVMSEVDQFSKAGKDSANFYNFRARANCQFGGSVPLVTLMQTLQVVGKIITYLNTNSCLDRVFTKDCLIANYVPNDFRPAMVKYVVERMLKKGFLRCDDKGLAMFNPTGGWGARLLGALATTDITKYLETDPNPELMNIKQTILNKFNQDDTKRFYLYNDPVEDLKRGDLFPGVVSVKKIRGYDFSLFSPPYFNIEKYADKAEGLHQSHSRYSTLDKWIRDFLLGLLDINHTTLKTGGVMVINIAKITVDRSLITNEQLLMNDYRVNPDCITSHTNPRYMVINLPEIIKHELSSGFRARLWTYLETVNYESGKNKSNNVLLFFKNDRPKTPIYHEIHEVEIESELTRQLKTNSSEIVTHRLSGGRRQSQKRTSYFMSNLRSSGESESPALLEPQNPLDYLFLNTKYPFFNAHKIPSDSQNENKANKRQRTELAARLCEIVL